MSVKNNRHMNLLSRAAALLVGWVLPYSLLAAVAADGLLTPYQARYEVFASGFSVGEAVISLRMPTPESYQMNSVVRPNGLVAVLASGQIDEQAAGAIQDGVIQPHDYARRLEAGKKSEQMQLRFDWAARQVQARYNTEQAMLPLAPGVVDPLSLQLLVMGDLQRNRLPEQYRLVDKTSIKSYQIRNQGQETLATPLGTLTTTRIQQFEPGKTRITTFWVAPALHYLLVRISQEKKGKEVIRMEIRAVDRSP